MISSVVYQIKCLKQYGCMSNQAFRQVSLDVFWNLPSRISVSSTAFSPTYKTNILFPFKHLQFNIHIVRNILCGVCTLARKMECPLLKKVFSPLLQF